MVFHHINEKQLLLSCRSTSKHIAKACESQSMPPMAYQMHGFGELTCKLQCSSVQNTFFLVKSASCTFNGAWVPRLNTVHLNFFPFQKMFDLWLSGFDMKEVCFWCFFRRASEVLKLSIRIYTLDYSFVFQWGESLCGWRRWQVSEETRQLGQTPGGKFISNRAISWLVLFSAIKLQALDLRQDPPWGYFSHLWS